MNQLNRRFFFIILGLVIMIWPGVVRDASAQSVNLDGVSVISYSSPWVQIEYTIEDPPDPISELVMTIQRFIVDLETDPTVPILTPVDSEIINFEDEIEDSWLDTQSGHNTGPVAYTISLAKQDDINNPIAFTDIHQTIFFHDVSVVDRCNGSTELRWNNYKYYEITSTIASGIIERPPYFTRNRIMYVPPGGGDERIATTLDFETESYEFDFQDGPGDYTIWLQAVEVDGSGNELRTSNSNYRTVPYDSPVLTNLEITLVNVVENRDINVVFYAEEGQPDDLDDFVFEVYRADDLEGEYALVGEGAPSSPSGYYSFTDSNIPGLRSGPYYYYVSGRLDECGVGDDDEASAVMSSLFLEGAIDTHTETQLTVWLEGTHEGTHFPVGMDYQLFRELPGGPDEDEWIFVGSFVPSQMFIDDLSSHIENLTGEIRYRVEGTSGTGGIFYSNEVIIPINVGLEIYNAFRPSSNVMDRNDEFPNRTFRPRLKGVIPSYFRLLVFNHWGQQMYSYTSQSGSLNDWIGWDGKNGNGQDVAPGVYGYRLEYQIGTGAREEVIGTVMLIR